jgi:hypothetical protein
MEQTIEQKRNINIKNLETIYKGAVENAGFKGSIEKFAQQIQDPLKFDKVYTLAQELGYKKDKKSFFDKLTEPLNPSDTPTVINKAAPKTAFDNLYDVYFKQYGGTDLKDTNIINIEASQKAAEKVMSLQKDLDTPKKLNLYAQADIKTQKEKLTRLQQIETAPDFVTTPSSLDLSNVQEEKRLLREQKIVTEENIAKQNKELEKTTQAWQSLMQEKVGIGYNPQSLKKVKELQATINEEDLFNTAVDVYNVGNFSKQRILKSLYHGELDREKMESIFSKVEETSVGLSKDQKDFYIHRGAEMQKESLEYSIKTEQAVQKEIKNKLLEFEKQVGDNPLTEQQQEYQNKLNTFLKESIESEKDQTLLRDKISMIGNQYGASFKLYQDVKKRQSEGVEGWVSPILQIVPNLFIAASKTKSGIKQNLASFSGVPEKDIEKYRVSYNSLIDEDINAIAQNKWLSSYTPTTSYDQKSWKNETLTYVNESGERVWNPRMIVPTALKVFLESYMIGVGGAATGVGKGLVKGVTTGAGMFVPTTVLFGGEIYDSYKERGIPTSKAGLMTFGALLAETASELINPLEINIAKGDGLNLINLTKSQAGRELYKNTVRQVVGSNKFDKLIDFITSTQRLTKEVGKQIGLEYVEELTAAMAGFVQENAYKNYVDPTFQIEDELTISDQITTFVTTAVGMSLMGGYQGFQKLKEYNKSSAFLVGKDPQTYIAQIKKDLEAGKITPEIANAQMQAVANAYATHQLLKEDFNNIDNLIYKSGKPVETEIKEEKKYELFKQAYNTKTLQDLILREKDPKKQEEILAKLDEYLLDFPNKKEEIVQAPEELTEEQKLSNYLNQEFPNTYIKNMGVPTSIKSSIETLQTKLEEVSEELKPIIQEKITALEQRLVELEQITTTTPLTEEDYNNYAKILLDEGVINEAQYNEFSPEEIKEQVDNYIAQQNADLEEFNSNLEDINTIENPEERLEKALEYKEELYKKPKLSTQKERISEYINELEALVEETKNQKSLKERDLKVKVNGQTLYRDNYVVLNEGSVWKMEGYDEKNEELKLTAKEGAATSFKSLTDLSEIQEQLSPEEAFIKFKEFSRKKQEKRIEELQAKSILTTEELKELQSLTEQNPVFEELEEETSTEDEQNLNKQLREFENTKTALNPLRTQVLRKKPPVGSVEQRWYDFLKYLRDLQNSNPLKTLKELGYTVSIVQGDQIPYEQMPDDTKSEIQKQFKQLKSTNLQEFYREYNSKYKILIISDAEGNPHLDKDGNHILSFLYNVEKNTDNTFSFKGKEVTVPSKDQLERNGFDKNWFQNQLKTLFNIKSSPFQKQTFEITSISKGILEDTSTEYKQTSTLTTTPDISLSITGAIQNKPVKKGTAYITINGTQYLLFRDNFPQKLIDVIWELSKPNPSKQNQGIFSTLPEELQDFYNRVDYINSLVYIGKQLKNKEGVIDTKLVLDKETKKWYYQGNEIKTKEELANILSTRKINIDKKTLLENNPFPIISFSDNKFTAEYTSYPKYITQNTQVKYLTGDETRYNPYLEFSPTPLLEDKLTEGEELVQAFGVTPIQKPSEDIEAKKADIERRTIIIDGIEFSEDRRGGMHRQEFYNIEKGIGLEKITLDEKKVIGGIREARIDYRRYGNFDYKKYKNLSDEEYINEIFNSKSLQEFLKNDAELTALKQTTKVEEPTITTSTNNEILEKEIKKPKVKRISDAELNKKRGLDSFTEKLEKVKTINNEATPEQVEKAKEWFESSPLSKFIGFEELFDVVNSDAYADWSLAGIRLYQGANYTDLYHESWHEFSQLYLTPKQRKALYNEVRNKVKTITLPNGTKISTAKATDFQIEEYVAEDFRKYVLSQGKNILDGRYQRNSLFRRLWNALKELFTGNNTLDVVYERLYTGNINKYNRNLNNSAFNILQKNIGNQERTLSYKEQREIFSNIDAIIASEVVANNVPFSSLFEKDGKVLSLAYNTVYNTMVEQIGALNELSDEELNSYADIYNDLVFLTEDSVFNQVVQQHKNHSDFLKLDRVLIQLEEQESEQLNKFENNDQSSEESTLSNLKDSLSSLNGNEISSKDKANKETIFIVGTLPKYDKDGNTIKSRLFPSFDFPQLLDIQTAWEILGGTLESVTNPIQQYSLISELAEKKPSFKHILERVQLISDQELTPSQLKTHIAFIQDMSKPLVRMYEVLIQNSGDGISVNTYPSAITSLTNVITEYNNNFQEVETQFKKRSPKTQLLELDLSTIIPYFEKINTSEKLREEFLELLGVVYSDDAIQSEDYKNLIGNKTKDDTLYYIYNFLKELQPYLKTRPDIDLSKPFTLLGKDLKDKNKQLLIASQRARRDALVNIELDNSYKFNSDNATNANGDSVHQKQDWNYISSSYADLNNFIVYPDYAILISEPHLSRFNIETNPIMRSNLYLNSLFILDKRSEDYGKRRKDVNNNPIQINLINYNGLKITSTETSSVGLTTTSLSKMDKFLQDLNSLLDSGIKEHIRYGDKSSSYGTLFKNFTTSSSFLPFHISSFSTPFVEKGEFNLPFKVLTYFKNKIEDELTTIYQSEQHSNILHYNNKSSNWQIFDGIKDFDELLKEFKDAMNQEDFTLDLLPALVKSKENTINKKLADYFQKQYENVKKDFDNIQLPINKKISQFLLNSNNLDTILRAFTINNFVVNVEHASLIAGDLRMYKSAIDVFKRLSAYSAPKNLSVVNDLVLRSITKYFPRLLRAKYNETPLVETNIINVAIFKDVKIASKLLSTYTKYFEDKGVTPTKIAQILDAYTKMEEGDGQGWITLDEYRKFKLTQKKWSTEQEIAYKKIANNEELTQDEIAFFPPIKAQYGGQLFTEELNVPGFHKFSLVPLIPQMVKDTSFEVIHEKMLKQDVGYALFSTGNKASAILENNQFNDFYENIDLRTPSTNNLFTQKVFYNYLGEQVNIEPEPKKKVVFSTQLRKLLFSNLFNNGTPLDYTDEKEWESLTEEEKLKNSTYYRNKEKFRDILQKMYNYHLEKLLDDVGATYTEGKFYNIDQQKLSNLLTKEFQSRNLPDNAYKILATKPDGTFKYPLDSSIMRNTIESVLVSIVDNRLRKQKINGDALVQVASSGFELNNFKSAEYSNDLPFYKIVKRIINGKEVKVTQAMKVKVAFNKSYHPLLKLKHTDGQPIDKLERLNEVIKNEEWLNKDDNRQLLSLVGVRIPVQGLNSQEFMEIFHFLPESSGSVIIVPSEIVAKSGGDFDIDKLSIFRPNINRKGELIKKKTDEELKSLYNNLVSRELSKDLDGNITPTDEQVNNLRNTLFSDNLSEFTEEDVKELLEGTKLESFEIFKNAFNKRDVIKIYENELISLIKQSLEDPKRFGELITPNGTYLFDEYKIEEKPLPISSIFTHTENLKQFQANLVGKATLGIAAVHNTFFQIMQEAGMYLNPTYLKPTNKGLKEYSVRILFSHNTQKGNISLSQISSTSEQSISEVISQMMNGYVDVAKGAWIFDVGLVKEVASTALFLNQAGVSLDDIQKLVNTPVIKEYVQNKINSNSIFLRNADPSSQENKTFKARVATFEKFGLQIVEKKSLDSIIGKQLSNFDKSSILEGTPTQILAHYIELENLANYHTSLMKGLNGDTNKSSSTFEAEFNSLSLEELLKTKLYPEDKVKYIQDKSVISPFLNEETGLKKLIPKLWNQVLNLSESQSLRDYITDEILTSDRLKTEYKFGNRDKFIKTFKNDLFLYIFQNYAKDPETNQQLSKVLFPLFETTTPNNIKERYTTFKKEYPDLFETNTFLSKLDYNLSKKSTKVNFELKVSKLDTASQNEFIEGLEQLLGHPDLKVKQFAKLIIYTGFIQSGLNKSFLSYTSLIPNEFYTSLISDAIAQMTKFLKTSQSNSFLKRYFGKFAINNPSFFTSIENPNTEPTRLKNYRDEAAPLIFSTDMKEDYTRTTKQNQTVSLAYKTEQLPSVVGNQGEIQTISEDYGVVQVETNPSKEKTEQFVELIKPQIQEQLYKENKGKFANEMFHYGLMWSRTNKKAKPVKIQKFEGISNNFYNYHELDQKGNPLPDLTILQPIIDEIQNSLGLDMSNYDSVIGNLYLDDQYVYPHKDTTESKTARNYPVIVYTIGNDAGLGIVDNNEGKMTFANQYDKQWLPEKEKLKGYTNELQTTNGSIYTFGLDGKGRFELTHSTPMNNKKMKDFPPITLPNGEVVTKYTITLTFRRAKDLEANTPISPIKLQPTISKKVEQLTVKVEVVSKYSNADVKSNPDKIYVFGDNTQRTGTGGQAQIRNNPNAFGIATKLKPTNNADAFMSDKDLESNKQVIDSDIAKIKAQNKPLVFPKDGFGTGLAKLKEKAPQTYQYLKEQLLDKFGFNNDTGELQNVSNQSTEVENKPEGLPSIKRTDKNC